MAMLDDTAPKIAASFPEFVLDVDALLARDNGDSVVVNQETGDSY
jgi:hypothetical protein